MRIKNNPFGLNIVKMKRIYSIILLVSLLIGTLQPILPMIEYQLFEGDIVELLNNESNNLQDPCSKIHDLVHSNNQDCHDSKNQQLLDIDYYPLSLEITTIPDPRVFLKSTRFYLPIVKDTLSPTFLPNPPPPRVVG